MSVRILAFNTVTELCSAALMIDKKIYDDCIFSPNAHAENILFMIHKLLIDSGVNLKSIDCIAFDQGPGKFMGIRLGLSIAQGLALGANLPLVAVSSLEVLAQGAFRICNSKYVISIVDAYSDKLYLALYCFNNVNKKNSNTNSNNAWTCIKRASCLNTKFARKIIHKLKDDSWALVGTGWNKDQELQLYINEKSKSIFFKKIMSPNSKDMLELALYSYNQKIFFDFNHITPLYLNTNLDKFSSNIF